MASVRHYILGAAGHVDHGKTALIIALTGTNTDRLKEEQARGISIELGFAEFDLGEGVLLGVVDMPGHERFVKQMVAGAGGVDLALLVVAADEGVMPQTVEHLEILDTLGVRGGVVVMSKTDLVDEDILAVASEEARDLVAGTFLADKPLIAVSAHKGEGLEELIAALRAQALALPTRGDESYFRLPVDRVFSMPGAGAIVTGTCWSGRVRAGDKLIVEPTGQKVRVREAQVHGRPVPQTGSGQRVALALHGVKKEELERGFQIVTENACTRTRRLDLRVDLFPHYSGTIKNRQRLHIHHAGREVLGRVVLLDEQELGGDAGPRSGLCQLHLEDELVARRGDRLVLRFYSPLLSIAGGMVLATRPPRHRRFDEQALEMLAVQEIGDPEELFRQNLREAGLAGLPLASAPEHADDPAAQRVGKRVFDRALLTEEAAAIAQLVGDYARRFPLRLGIPKEEARRKRKFKGGVAEWNALCQTMAAGGDWALVGDRIAATAEGPELAAPLAAAVARREEALAAYGLQWPGLTVFSEQLAAGGAAATEAATALREEEYLKYLSEHGRAVQIASDDFVHADAFMRLGGAVRDHFAAAEELSFADFRELSGLTRKLGIPTLEYLDQAGYTKRCGDLRQAGVQLAAGP